MKLQRAQRSNDKEVKGRSSNKRLDDGRSFQSGGLQRVIALLVSTIFHYCGYFWEGTPK